MITIKVNGENKELGKDTNIADFLKGNNINPIGVTIEHNFEVIDSKSIAEIMLKDGDTLEILRFVGGG
ncbi:MAG: sulfur carrier protein ThiS [Endomicrobium sp.]|jgi:thiamine biosynthesis protein ThiS|nr:sulfur carrier protein ThiS [Endomicrobium sp.]